MAKANGQEFYFGTALWRAWTRGYHWRDFKLDALAAITVALVALPLSMALAIAVGVPPQHGLYTAIVAGFVVAVLGGSATQVTGPTAAFIVILAPIVAVHGLRGLLIAQVLAGILLLLMGMFKLGRYIRLVPYPVVTGFTAGIAVVIGLLSLNDLLGLQLTLAGDTVSKAGQIFGGLTRINLPEATVGLATLLVMVGVRHRLPRLPAALIGILIGVALMAWFEHTGIDIVTIGERFSYTDAGGLVQAGIPPYPPMLHLPYGEVEVLFRWPAWAEVQPMLIPAMMIAALAALESLLSATVADGMTNSKHAPNTELNALGVGNILAALAGGIAATGAIARTAANIQAGGRTPVAAALHALILLLFVLLIAPQLSLIPMASLAAVLALTAYHMSHWRQCIRIARIAPKSEVVVLAITFMLTVVVDMVAGVAVGILLASLLFLQRVADLTELHEESRILPANPQLKMPARRAYLYHFTGPLFFGSVEQAMEFYDVTSPGIDLVVIDLEAVSVIDMSGIVALQQMISTIRMQKTVAVCGPERMLAPIRQKIHARHAREPHFFADVETALKTLHY
jgi:SulP family sulfate permease